MKSMKRTIAMLLTLALVFASFPLGAFAEQELVAEQSSEVEGVSPAEPQTEVKQEAEEETPLEIQPEEEKEALQAPANPSEDEGERRLLFQLGYASQTQHGHSVPSDPRAANDEAVRVFKNIGITVSGMVNGELRTVKVKPELVNTKGEPFAFSLNRNGGTWPVGTVVTITFDNEFLKNSRFHLSYTGPDDIKQVVTGGYEKVEYRIDDKLNTYRIGLGRMDVGFDPNGGTFTNGKNLILSPVQYDNHVVFPAPPKKDGFFFKGWYTKHPRQPTRDGGVMVYVPEGNYGSVVMWSETDQFSDRNRDWKLYNDLKYDDTYDWIFRLRAMWLRPELTFYSKERREITDENKAASILQPIHKAYLGASLKNTKWDATGNEDLNKPGNPLTELPGLDAGIIPEGRRFKNRWVYYTKNSEGNEIQEEFTMNTLIQGDMELYPLFERPTLTFYKQEKEDIDKLDKDAKKAQILDPVHEVCFDLSLEDIDWDAPENRDINTQKNRLKDLPGLDADSVPAGKLFKNRWVYYEMGENGELTAKEFKKDTVVKGDMELYPLFERPTLTFYIQEQKNITAENKEDSILQPIHKAYLGASLEGTQWGAQGNEDINEEGNPLTELPELPTEKIPAGKMFNNRWVYYAANDTNFEHPQEFTMKTEVKGDMELYPLFERPTLTFYNKEKKDLTEENKKDSILKPIHKAYLGASLENTPWDAEGNEDINTEENKLTELPVPDAIPSGMKFKHWVYYTTGTDGKEVLQEFTLGTKIEGNMELYPVFEKKDSSDPSNPPTPPTPKPDDPSKPSDPSKPTDPTKPSTPDKPSPNVPSEPGDKKPGTDSGIKTPKGSPLTSSEIAKILAGTKKTVPYIPRAGVGK